MRLSVLLHWQPVAEAAEAEALLLQAPELLLALVRHLLPVQK
jgi:hypothetical protein